jgi:hypothetical protein
MSSRDPPCSGAGPDPVSTSTASGLAAGIASARAARFRRSDHRAVPTRSVQPTDRYRTSVPDRRRPSTRCDAIVERARVASRVDDGRATRCLARPVGQDLFPCSTCSKLRIRFSTAHVVERGRGARARVAVRSVAGRAAALAVTSRPTRRISVLRTPRGACWCRPAGRESASTRSRDRMPSEPGTDASHGRDRPEPPGRDGEPTEGSIVR